MQLINFNKTSKLKASAVIDKEYGGRYSFKEAIDQGGIGIGKLYYLSGCADIDRIKDSEKKYKSNIEIYKDGIGIYVYNVDDNFLMLYKPDEISSFHIHKPADRIKVEGFSFFQKMIDWNIDFYKCKIMLLEHEQVELHPVSFDIHLSNDTILKNTIYRYHPYKHIAFAEDNILRIPLKEQIQTYELWR